MGLTSKLSSLNQDRINKLLLPIIFCADFEKISDYILDYKIVSINKILSKELISSDQDINSLRVEHAFDKIIDQSGEPLLIKDFEILFNPDYKIDVLKLFIKASRKKRIYILWSGKFKEDKLLFAEPGFLDYKSYKISDYDISCVI